MSHNVLLDLTDTHQHSSTSHTPLSSTSKYTSFRYSNHNRSNWFFIMKKQFNIPSSFHDLFILFKRIFWLHRRPRFIKFYFMLILTCFIIFALFFNDSLTYKAHQTVTANRDQIVGNDDQYTTSPAYQQKSDSSNNSLDVEKNDHSQSKNNQSIGLLMSNGFSFKSSKLSSSSARSRPSIGRIQPMIEKNYMKNSLNSGYLKTPQQEFNDVRVVDRMLSNSYSSLTDLYSGQAVAMSPPSISSSSLPQTFDLIVAKDFQKIKLNQHQLDIIKAMQHSWNNYKRYAWGSDMLKPRSKEPDQWFNLGLTIVDSVDTLIMMNLQNEVNNALEWIETVLDLDRSNNNANCFEVTIRLLGGLLSAYHLKPERSNILTKAKNLGDRLLHCYDTGSGTIPNSDIDLADNRSHAPSWYPYSSLSEVSSIQLEFRDLTRLTGQANFESTTFKTSQHLHNLIKEFDSALLPMYISPSDGKMDNSYVLTLGARADSYYEYLLKQYLQTGISWLEEDYLRSIKEIKERLMRTTGGELNLTFITEIHKDRSVDEDHYYENKMDHLVCFLPGTLILGYYHFSPKAVDIRAKYALHTPQDKLKSDYDYHLDMAEAISRTCYAMYNNTATGLSPEIAFFGSSNDKVEYIVHEGSAHNILRPEFIESLFYLYHITGNTMYRHQAREVFDSFNKYCRVPGGYSPVSDVRRTDNNLDNAPDRMESFWMSETLKYLFLVFCDDEAIIGRLLNDYIFNTEAHLIPRKYPSS